MKKSTRLLSVMIALIMVFSLLPVSALAEGKALGNNKKLPTALSGAGAANDYTLDDALSDAKTYVDALTINSTLNVPSKVVSTFGTQFSWDNEKRESANKSYLFEWSYYNGVVFEGLDYLAMASGNSAYESYVSDYLSGMISGSTWKTCSNNSSKQCSGYNAGHGLDCYKTASLLMDYGYEDMAAVLYADLQNAERSYTSSSIGGNFYHTWSGTPSYKVWLDGIYMAQPFMAEYAYATGDTAELGKIADRFEWVGNNMYNASNGLYYHAANSASDHPSGYWLRAIGWYAAAMVDVMDYMSGDDLTAMKTQFKKLVDGMLPYQDADTGMWHNYVDTVSTRLETSGTALMAYAIAKAVNNGWLDSSYMTYAESAFTGMCETKLNGTTLTDICFKGSPGTTNANNTFYDNEGKGVGPFIMAYAQILNGDAIIRGVDGTPTVPEDPDEPDEPDEPDVPDEPDEPETGIVIKDSSGNTITPVVTELTAEDNANAFSKASVVLETVFGAYDIVFDVPDGEYVTVSLPIAENMLGRDDLAVYYIPDSGDPVNMNAEIEDGFLVFITDHNSVYIAGIEETTTGSSTATGSITGQPAVAAYYELVANGASGVTTTDKYLIASGSSGNVRVLTTSGARSSSITVSSSKIADSAVEDTYVFTFESSGTNWLIHGSTGYLYTGTSGSSISNGQDRGQAMQISGTSSVTIKREGTNGRYLRYSDRGGFSANRTSGSNLYLFKYVPAQEAVPGKTVVFSVGSDDTIPAQLGETVTLDPMIKLDNVEITAAQLANSTIAWTSGNESVATVDANGIVTPVGAGTATITATLSTVNGNALTRNLTVRVNIEVTDVTIVKEDSYITPNWIEVCLDDEVSGAVLNATYSNGSTETITTGLTYGTQIDTSVPGTYMNVPVLYNGVQYGTVNVRVLNKYTYEGADEATDYAEYPDAGAIMVDKTAREDVTDFNHSGVTQVELDVAGISMKSAVDVILVVDVSNSMNWSMDWFENSSYTNDYQKDAGYGTNDSVNKLSMAMDAADEFAKVLLLDDDGNNTGNSVSFVTFAGYDDAWCGKASGDTNVGDSVMTVFSNVTDYSKAHTSFSGTTLSNTLSGTTSTRYLTVMDENGNKIVNEVVNRGDTNYDFAFYQAQQALNELWEDYGGESAYKASGRESVVVFMTDGAASQYNGSARSSRYSVDKYPVTGKNYANNSGNNATQWYNVINTENALALSLYNNVDGFYAIGFDLAHGGFSTLSWTEAELGAVLAGLVRSTGNDIPVHLSNDAEDLKEFYASLAEEIKKAATKAQVNDIINGKFTLQIGSTITEVVDDQSTRTVDLQEDFGFTPNIVLTRYEIYTENDPAAVADPSLIGTRKDSGTVIEEVSFAVDNDGTKHAYSSLLGNNNDILTSSDGYIVIEAKNFTYTNNNGVESFDWKIGDVSNDEVTLTFYAYLKGALKGTAPQGIYYTNEKATLEYLDINGNHATQTFPVPNVIWGGAATNIVFYYVNEYGQPVNRNGQVITGDARLYVTVGDPVAVELNKNASGQYEADHIRAMTYLPAGFLLYDNNADYYLLTDATGTGGERFIPVNSMQKAPGDPTKNTTFLYEYTDGYMDTTVYFAVLYGEKIMYSLPNDQIVIDYGKQVNGINIRNNDIFDGDAAEFFSNYDISVVGLSDYVAAWDNQTKITPAKAEEYKVSGAFPVSYTGKFGNFTLDSDSTISYQPTKLASAADGVLVLLEFTQKGGDAPEFYLAEKLEVIPATIMYYETDFAEGVFTLKANSGWETVTGGTPDDVQDTEYVGEQQNVYGYDPSYTDDTLLSNGKSLFINNTTGTTIQDAVTFSFTGTGIDFISRTGVNEGTVRVDVTNRKTGAVKSVSVLNKSDGSLELYQIPVISIEGLAYGTYDVTLRVLSSYTAPSEVYKSLERGGEFYFDAIRIYNPAQDELSTSAYSSDNESDPTFYEIREKLISADKFYAVDDGEEEEDAVVFLDYNYDDESHTTVKVEDYTAWGPNNEVYLANGQAIAFMIDSDISFADLAVKAIGQGSATFNLWVGEDKRIDGESITSATAQYYDIGALYTDDIVIIQNTGAGVLSITDLKAVNGMLLMSVNQPVLAMARFVMCAAPVIESDEPTAEPDEPVIEPEEPVAEPEIFKPESFTVNIGNGGVKAGKTFSVTVTTSAEVETVKVNGTDMKLKKTDRRTGMKTWTATLEATGAGTMTIEAVAYCNGVASTPITGTLEISGAKVQKKSINDMLTAIGSYFSGLLNR